MTPSVKIASQSPGCRIDSSDSYVASSITPSGTPPASSLSIEPVRRRNTGLLCPALTYVSRRDDGSYSAINAVVNRRPLWLLLQAYRFILATSSVNGPCVLLKVFKLAWKVAISIAAGMLLPATSATAMRKVLLPGSAEARAKTS